MKKKQWFFALLCVSIIIVGGVAYRVGYSRGTEDQKLRVIPFNLDTHFQMYKLCDYINSPEKYASPPPYRILNAKMSMFAQIYAYDANRERFDDLGVDSDYFDSLLEKCRPIISDLYDGKRGESGASSNF